MDDSHSFSARDSLAFLVSGGSSLIVVAAIACVLIAVVQASLFEWAFHRYWLHRPWLPKECFTSHTLVHHQLCKFDDTFKVVEEEQEEALTFAWWGGPVLVAINVTPWIFLAWGLSAAGKLPFFLLPTCVAATCALYYIGYEGLHYLMHKPTIPWIERSRYFKFIERHHRIHHFQMDRNLNVLLPIGDFLLGSLVLEAAEPAGTREGARKLARRHSRFGRRLREEHATPVAGARVVAGATRSSTGGANATRPKAFIPDEAEGTAASGQGH